MNPFATTASLSELCFWFRRFIVLVQTKKVIYMNYGSSKSTSSWKPWRWVRLGLILTMMDIYINPTWTHSQNSLATVETQFEDILPWNFSQMKQGIPFWVCRKVNGLIYNQIVKIRSEFPSGGKAIVEKVPTSEKINKSKRARLWESQSWIQVGKLTIWVRLFEIEKL